MLTDYFMFVMYITLDTKKFSIPITVKILKPMLRIVGNSILGKSTIYKHVYIGIL